MGKFTFNKYGVCVNPEIIDIDKHILLQIAEDDKGIFYLGFDIQFNRFFHVKPCMSTEAITKKDALERIAREVSFSMEEHYFFHENYQEEEREIKTSMENVKDYIHSLYYTQLTLF